MLTENKPGASEGVQPPPYTQDENPEIVIKYEDEKPTASHSLADAGAADDPEEYGKGAAQVDHDALEVKNLGWNDDQKNVAQLVGGLRNEDLWTLIRRFDKQIFCVKRIDEPPLANLDMNIAEDEDFSPEKMRAQLERFYIVVVMGLLSLYKHVARLRSWKETQRTSIFLALYVVAWLLDLLVPTAAAFAMVLVLFPRTRNVCFPPAPPALINADTGGVQKPPAGVLASDDSFTGAPEKHAGEAVEQEAHSFVNSISTLVISTAAGANPEEDPYEDNSVPDPTELTADIASAKDKATGGPAQVEHDRTKKPVSRAVWSRAEPLMHILTDVVDSWERFGNALSPTAPFPRLRPRLTLAASLLPLVVGSYFTTAAMMVKGLGFGVGFAFFGDPIITPSLHYVNVTFPNWQEHLQLRHTLLRGIPTNAQVAVTLLRIGERNKAPIPPPPTSNTPPAVEAHPTAGEGLDHLEAATDEEIQEAVRPDPDHGLEDDDEIRGKGTKGHRILNFLRTTAKGGVQTALTADRAKAAAGAHHARDRRGAVRGSKPTPRRGPVSFPARFRGKKGHAYITATATTPAVSWTSNIEDVKPAWTVAIGDIDEVRKVGGLGWKSKILVGWAMGSEIVDGLVIKTRKGEEFHLTAINLRDELFNRLIAIGNQMWEAR